MNNTWTHLCGSQIKQVAWGSQCPECNISSAVESLRFAGFTPTTTPAKKSWLTRLWAKRPSTKKNTKPYEYQDDYYDRHG